MSVAHKRRKQPDAVRHQLLDVAARLCIENGLHALTLDAVAKEAGVSKGGLLHHFPSKQALLEALSNACLEDFEGRLGEQLEKDKGPAQGRFARAYLQVTVSKQSHPAGEHWDNLGVMLMSDANMRAAWHTWLEKRLAEHKDTDSTMASLIVRLAADGLWLSDFSGSPWLSQAKRKRLIALLVEMSTQVNLSKNS
jgi:AcrR family transcriptional regulator